MRSPDKALRGFGLVFLVAAAFTNPKQLDFTQNGTGAVKRSIASKLGDQISVLDFGATGNGTTDDSTADQNARAALTSGGLLLFPSSSKTVYTTYYPALATVNHHDTATIGTSEQITNTGFTGSPATGWTLANFTSANPTITHTAGTVGTASRSVTASPSVLYLLTITLTTTTAGTIDFSWGTSSLTDSVPIPFPVAGSTAYTLSYLSANNLSGGSTFTITTDTAWAGTITSVSLLQITTETQFAYMGLPTDDLLLQDPMGVKFGRYNAGNLAIGDRQTASLASSTAAWNIAIGARALGTNQNGIENTCVGSLACEFNATDRLTGYGYSALKYNTSGIQNTGLGYKSGYSNTTGSSNTASGFWALLQNQTGSNNTAFGVQAGYSQLSDSYTTAIGYQSGLNNRGGAENTYVGGLAGMLNANVANLYSYNFTTSVGAESKVYGDNGTAVGFQARVGADGAANTTSTAVGQGAVSAFNNCTSLGAAAACSAANEVRLGTSSNYVAAARYAPISKGDSTGSPGNATINLQMGRSTINNTTSAITITNSLVAAGSLVFAQLATADATCTFIKSVVPASGSFVITVNAACTGNVNVSWQVW